LQGTALQGKISCPAKTVVGDFPILGLG